MTEIRQQAPRHIDVIEHAEKQVAHDSLDKQAINNAGVDDYRKLLDMMIRSGASESRPSLQQPETPSCRSSESVSGPQTMRKNKSAKIVRKLQSSLDIEGECEVVEFTTRSCEMRAKYNRQLGQHFSGPEYEVATV
eukprot:CAMPEP_0196719774 /NCGR_PEP_ID=MMETSP1091-20130531/2708_1 /TAXON_ID=302021 /ORGANISM="Rhodomonas sp., Strain CCMP768" /LENGTH=135 /DNA_ID=CAMNT_0042060823 /DNA_START=26 /DNA_END=433 /DNA_ORIENTATION=-